MQAAVGTQLHVQVAVAQPFIVGEPVISALVTGISISPTNKSHSKSNWLLKLNIKNSILFNIK